MKKYTPKVGEFARTRDGRKVYVAQNRSDGFCGYLPSGVFAHWNFEGIFCIGEYEGSYDLIAPWEDERDKVLEEVKGTLEYLHVQATENHRGFNHVVKQNSEIAINKIKGVLKNEN